MIKYGDQGLITVNHYDNHEEAICKYRPETVMADLDDMDQQSSLSIYQLLRLRKLEWSCSMEFWKSCETMNSITFIIEYEDFSTGSS